MECFNYKVPLKYGCTAPFEKARHVPLSEEENKEIANLKYEHLNFQYINPLTFEKELVKNLI